jgi:hypothetical protein
VTDHQNPATPAAEKLRSLLELSRTRAHREIRSRTIWLILTAVAALTSLGLTAWAIEHERPWWSIAILALATGILTRDSNLYVKHLRDCRERATKIDRAITAIDRMPTGLRDAMNTGDVGGDFVLRAQEAVARYAGVDKDDDAPGN